MSLATIFYFAGISETLQNVLGITCGIGLFYFVFHTMVASDSSSVKKPKKAFLYVFIACGFIAAFIPSKNTIYMMFGASVAESVVKDERTKEIGEKLLKLANQKLDEALEKKK